jgi:hypothetical protein
MDIDEITKYANAYSCEANLINKFNYLTKDLDQNDRNTKFTASIPATDFEEYNDASIHYTGYQLQVVKRYKKDGEKYIEVLGRGRSCMCEED